MHQQRALIRILKKHLSTPNVILSNIPQHKRILTHHEAYSVSLVLKETPELEGNNFIPKFTNTQT